MIKEVRKHLNGFDLDGLDLVEQKEYYRLISEGFTKPLALLELMGLNEISENLQELKELILEYDETTDRN